MQEAALHKQNIDGKLEDLEVGIETIEHRSNGLLKFAETYRNLNKITEPNTKRIRVLDLFENLQELMEASFQQKSIELDIILKDPQISIDADSHLVEQVLINLLVNAVEAVKEIEYPRIAFSAYQESNKTVLKVSDNGAGIPPELIDQIFIPFFSTRKSGSGIGLSLSKQIMLDNRLKLTTDHIKLNEHRPSIFLKAELSTITTHQSRHCITQFDIKCLNNRGGK